MGNVISLPLSGLLADNFGWEYVYYVFGGAALLFSALWSVLAFDAPNKHPRITEVSNYKFFLSVASELDAC